MIAKSARFLLIGLLSLCLAAALATCWLLYTEAGARWAWSRVEAALGERLGAATVAGTLSRGLTLTRLDYRDASRSLSVEKAVIAINPDLFPTRVVLETLVLDAVELREASAPSAASTDGPPLEQVLAALRPPFPLLLRHAAVHGIERVSADGSRRKLLDTLEFSGQLFESLDVDALRVRAPGVEIGLHGGLGLAAPFAVDPGTAVTAALTGDMPVRARATFDGTLADLGFQVTGDTPSFRFDGSMTLIGDQPAFAFTAQSPRLGWPLQDPAASMALEDLRLEASGWLTDYAVSAKAVIVGDGFGRFDAGARAHGSLERIAVDALQLSSPALAASATGSVQWAPALVIDAAADVSHLDAARWIANWPDAGRLHGRVAARYGERRIEVSTLELQQADGAAQLAASGVVDLTRGVVDGQLAWERLQWPFAPAPAEIASRSGDITVSGAPDDWSVAGEVIVSAPEVAEGRFRMAGDGDLDGVTLHIADSAVLGGKVTGDLAVGWRGHGAWSATLSADNVRIRPFLPRWPGRISTDFRASGQREPLQLSLDIAALDGELRGRPVSASGHIALAGGDVRVNKLLIASGESRVQLDGAYRDADGLTFDATLASLDDLLPGAAGRVRAGGNVAASTGVPRLALQLDATDVRWQDMHAAAIKLANAPLAGRPFDLSFEASKVVVSGNALDTVSAALVGTPQQHRLELAAALASSRARLALQGGVDRIDTLAAANWEGQLAEFGLTGGDTLSMTLERPTALRLSARAMSLNRSCLLADDGSAVCLSASRSGRGAYASVIELGALPLNLVHLFVDNELEFSQTLDGTVQVSKPPHGAVSAGGRIAISPGEIRNTLDERLTLKTRTGFARFALDSGSLLSGELSLPFSDTAELAGEFRVMDVAQGTGSAVDGFVRANVSDIGVAAGIVPMIDQAGGRFEANIRIDGTLDAPRFAGAAALSDGLLVYDPLGMRVEDIQLDAEIRAGNRIEVQSTFRAGEGRGRITTSADYLQGRQAGLELAFSGNNLTLVDVPTLQVHANADLTLGLHENDVTIDGKVVLPRARLSSVNITSTSVTESADVEVVGNGTTAANGQNRKQSALDYHGSIDLELGDDVVIDVDLAQARLRGASTFAWNGSAMPIANGSYDVSGKFQAYGQLLEITEGSIRYPNVPANRPELRIRAERDIFGNSEVRRAGVLVTGTATRPTLEVYTTPATTGDRALTLLVTGSDFDYEQGVGAVDVGTYIAPRLYASYGVGLFDKENVISVRYDLAKGFGIKATSGKRADGVDISYTIEH